MSPRGSQERRTAPRVGAQLPIQLIAGDSDQLITTESMNLSKSGISCETMEFVAPLSKVALTLILPKFGNLTKSSRILRAEGVVVRCEPVRSWDSESLPEASDRLYEIACYFTSVEEESRNLLDAFVAWKLLRGLHSGEERGGRTQRKSSAHAGVSNGSRRTSHDRSTPARRGRKTVSPGSASAAGGSRRRAVIAGPAGLRSSGPASRRQNTKARNPNSKAPRSPAGRRNGGSRSTGPRRRS